MRLEYSNIDKGITAKLLNLRSVDEFIQMWTHERVNVRVGGGRKECRGGE